MAVRTRCLYERGDFVDQLQRGEHQIARAIEAGLGIVIDQMPGIQCVQMLKRAFCCQQLRPQQLMNTSHNFRLL